MKIYLVEHADSEAVIETFVIAAREEEQAILKAGQCSRCPKPGERSYAPVIIEGKEIPYHATARVIGITMDELHALAPIEFSPGEVICASECEWNDSYLDE